MPETLKIMLTGLLAGCTTFVLWLLQRRITGASEEDSLRRAEKLVSLKKSLGDMGIPSEMLDSPLRQKLHNLTEGFSDPSPAVAETLASVTNQSTDSLSVEVAIMKMQEIKRERSDLLREILDGRIYRWESDWMAFAASINNQNLDDWQIDEMAADYFANLGIGYLKLIEFIDDLEKQDVLDEIKATRHREILQRQKDCVPKFLREERPAVAEKLIEEWTWRLESPESSVSQAS